MDDTLTRARQAVKDHEWQRALGLLLEVDADEPLGPEDQILLADAYWWNGQPDEGVAAFEKAFNLYEKAGQPLEAAVVAARLAYLAARRQAMSVAAGWVARLEELVDGQPESLGEAWKLIIESITAMQSARDFDAAIESATRAADLGRRIGQPSIEALALSFKAFALIQQGSWREGMQLADQATVVALSGSDDLRATADVYCNTIAMCRNLGDYRRAAEWTGEAERWMGSHGVAGYPGVCKVHRAELKRLHGFYAEAEEEAKKACEELERYHILDGVGFAHYEIGESKRRLGDLDGAERAFNEAYRWGSGAQPGRSLLSMDRGDLDGAAESINASIQRLLESERKTGSRNVMSWGKLLPAQVEIAIARGDVETARQAIQRLEELAEIYEGPVWEASAMSCRGSLELAEGNSGAAVEDLSAAWRLWQSVDLPYEAARTRTALGHALAETGDTSGATMEFRAARDTFQSLGSRRDVATLNELLGETASAGQREVRAFMFTDIVTSTDLIGLIGDEAWEALLAWHDRTLREEIEAANGEVVHHTGDGLFAAFEEADSVFHCAVSAQRRLSAHRLEHGFAPKIRVGIHRAEATKRGSDYSGQGVHIAARVGDAAAGDEILATTTAIEQAGQLPYEISAARHVELRGIADDVEVASVEWRSRDEVSRHA